MKQTLLTCITLAALFTASCNAPSSESTTKETTSTTESNTERNKKIIMASVDGINNHNPDAVLKDAASDIVDYGDGTMGTIKGVDSIKAMMNSWMAAFPDYKMDNVEYIAEGNKVVATYDASGTWKGDFMGAKATNKAFKIKDVDIFTLNNAGKVTSHRSIQNSANLMASIGMPMPAGAPHDQAH
jgi:predicted ester cyclase